jgi:4-hydroxymandelate oxidase
LVRLGAFLAASPLARAQEAPKIAGEPPGRIPPLDELINTLEFEPVAQRKLADVEHRAIAGGERAGFERIVFRPRLMVNTQELDLTTELFGDALFTPIVVGPASHQLRFHPEGELAMARGATAATAALVVADRSDTAIDEIAAVAAKNGGPLWFQVYPEPDVDELLGRVGKAVAAGCKAVCLTVGTPYGPTGAGGYPQVGALKELGFPGLNWGYVERVREAAKVPLLLKGIMSAEEAAAAVERGIDGLVVSNHGGRFVRGVAEPITVLPEIVDAVGGRAPVLVDGGFRRGSDVLKALVFGATAVLVSRPALWGLAAYGADGVRTVVELLQTELARDMAMLGAANAGALSREFVKVDGR